MMIVVVVYLANKFLSLSLSLDTQWTDWGISRQFLYFYQSSRVNVEEGASGRWDLSR